MSPDLTPEIKASLDRVVADARRLEESGDTAGAARKWNAAGRLMLQFADRAPSRRLELSRKQRAIEYRERSQALEAGERPGSGGGRGDDGDAGGGRGSGGDRRSRADRDRDDLHDAVAALVTAADVDWEQVGGLEPVKQQIKISLALAMAQAPEGVRLEGWRNMLFFGPPGTGKTLLAAAVSNALRPRPDTRSVFYNVKVSSVMSKYFGESTRILSELYGTARDTSPSVVFLDEFDALSGDRDRGDESGAERRLLATLLAELDGLAEKERSDLFVLTIAATNRPWDLDPAVLSRFDRKILIPLPDAVSRAEILRIHLAGRGYEVEPKYGELAARTDGLSGRELARLAKDTVTAMILEENAGLPDLLDRGVQGVRDYRVKVRPLTMGDFDSALAGVTPVTRADDMERYRRWDEENS